MDRVAVDTGFQQYANAPGPSRVCLSADKTNGRGTRVGPGVSKGASGPGRDYATEGKGAGQPDQCAERGTVVKPKNELIPTLTLGENFRLAMTRRGLTFKDLARKAKVDGATTYRVAGRTTPTFVTKPVLRLGRVLGFTEGQIAEKVSQDRLLKKKTFSKKELFYSLIAELIELFDSKEA